MKRITLILVSFFLILSCNSSKKIQKQISAGNYDTAIFFAIKKLRKNSDKKKKQPIIKLLEKAYDKAVEKDYRNLSKYKIDNNPAVIKNIYKTFIKLDKRQELIRPLLPLHIKDENRNALFIFRDYKQDIEDSKNSLSEYLYVKGIRLLKSDKKDNARKAYDELKYLDKINPNFKNVDSLLDIAHFKGTNFVNVILINNTHQVIPYRLEQDLLDFNTYGLDKFWTQFDSQKNENINYDYELALIFKRIDISPERIIETKTPINKTIKDGFEYVLDSEGNIKLDSLGNKIKIDKFINVSADFYKIHQEKASNIEAEVVLYDVINKEEVESFPINSEFIFVNDFGDLDGDKRALNAEQLELLNHREIPFPTNEQMIYDTGEDLKEKFKNIIEDFDFL
jgi:hypothetical protein